ncbi:class I SAM-dependent methyltransferase [Candidatus Latescibacterota bacterium]
MKNTPLASKNCPLCLTADPQPFHEDLNRSYLRCETCQLAFVPSEEHLSHEEEKIRYDMHENSHDNKGYREFLSRLFTPLQERLNPAGSGLDFGSGPGPVLSDMLREAGHSMTIYDPYFAHDPDVLNRQYDFITATEVVEHLCHPGTELERLWTCLKPGGLLGVMTKLVLDKESFSRWHYIRDLTHVSFFSKATFRWLSAHWDAHLTFIGTDVMLFRKTSI